MRGYWSIVKKEIVHIRRDPATLVFALALPLIQLIIFGFAINLDVRHMSTVVVDQDQSRESRAYLEKLRATQYLDLDTAVGTSEEATSFLRAGKAKVAVIIPPGFSEKRASGNTAQIGVLIDGSDSTTATRARSAFGLGSGHADVEPRMNMLFNPTMRTETFMVPGLIAIILQLVLVSLTSFSLVKERESGTLEQLMVSPVGRLGLMTGKITPYAGLAFVEMAVVLLAGYFLFDVRIAGSVLLLVLLSIPFIVGTLGIGLLISTIAKNQAQALQFSIMFLMPSILMSGFAFPRETQPGMLYLISNIVPATHYLNIVRGIVVRGASFLEVQSSVWALMVIALISVGLSVARFKKSIG